MTCLDAHLNQCNPINPNPNTTTEEGADLIEFSLEPHRDSLLGMTPSQFFSGFRLREFDETDAGIVDDGERTIGIVCVMESEWEFGGDGMGARTPTDSTRGPCALSTTKPKTNRFRGFMWFLMLLYPYMGIGLLCSITAQALATQGGNPNGAPLDVVDFPDLKSIHGFVGTILGTFCTYVRVWCVGGWREWNGKDGIGWLCVVLIDDGCMT